MHEGRTNSWMSVTHLHSPDPGFRSETWSARRWWRAWVNSTLPAVAKVEWGCRGSCVHGHKENAQIYSEERLRRIMQRLVNYELKIYFPVGKRMCLIACDDENGAQMTKLISSDKRIVKHGGHLYRNFKWSSSSTGNLCQNCNKPQII